MKAVYYSMESRTVRSGISVKSSIGLVDDIGVGCLELGGAGFLGEYQVVSVDATVMVEV